MSRMTRSSLMLLPILIMFAVSPHFAKGVRSMAPMKLTSPAFASKQSMPAKFSCDGDDINPPLVIEGVPKEARSLALVMDDPDAPAGVWVHWVLWNINPATREIAQGSVPPGAQQGLNSWGRKSYGGPCPPSGTHRYFFRLYALKEQPNLPASPSRKDLDRAIKGSILAQSELFGVYSRN